MQKLTLTNSSVLIRTAKTEKVYTSKGNLSQHVRGKHEGGWTAYCGEHIKWKSKYNRHIHKCTECKEIREKKKKERYHFL